MKVKVKYVKKNGEISIYEYNRNCTYKSRLLSEEEGIKYYSELYPNEVIKFNKDYNVFVSDQGNVFSRSKKMSKHKLNHDIHGYVGFKNITVHKLVMLTFDKYVEGLEIDHINNDRSDNRLCNLQMVTHAENIRKRVPPMKDICGKLHGRSIPVVQYDLNGNFIKEWESANMASKELGIGQPSITACCKHRKGFNSCGGYKWEYAKKEGN